MAAGSRRSRSETVSNGGAALRASAADPPAKPTIRAVAELADVAISTVSRVVNGGRASELIRRRVQRAVDELGYTPSVAAQSLVLRRTGCIGLAVNSSQSPWFSQILAGIEEALAPSRKSVVLASMVLKGQYDPAAVLAWIAEGRVDGLILVRYSRRDRPLIEAAAKARVPVVLIAPDVAAPSDFSVRSNNFEAGGLVAQHLAQLGHRRVAFAGGPQESFDTRQRLEGLREGLAEKGVSLDPDWIWFGPGYGRDSGVEYAQLFLSRPETERPSAVVLGNDPMALGFMRSVLRHGVSVPGDVSVVGFDGTPDGEQVWPGLTTVSQPTQQMALAACQALLDSVDRRHQDRSTSVEFAVQLLLRESTAPPRQG
ncbi:MAG TPA: LacI family DNA-binding transcriptional regulator [Polyangiaceae bacterium]|nr:LacI family DNA-binding transcriptional regulator [Polyangiaceae bacterium]